MWCIHVAALIFVMCGFKQKRVWFKNSIQKLSLENPLKEKEKNSWSNFNFGPAPPFSWVVAQPATSSPFPSLSPTDRPGPPIIPLLQPPLPLPLSLRHFEEPRARAALSLPHFPLSSPLLSSLNAHKNRRRSASGRPRAIPPICAATAPVFAVVSIAYSPSFSLSFSRSVSWPLGPCSRATRVSSMAPPRTALRGSSSGRAELGNESASFSSFSRYSRFRIWCTVAPERPTPASSSSPATELRRALSLLWPAHHSSLSLWGSFC